MITTSNDLGLDDNEEVVFASIGMHSTHVISISSGGNLIMKNSVALQSSVLKQADVSRWWSTFVPGTLRRYRIQYRTVLVLGDYVCRMPESINQSQQIKC